MSHQPRTLLNEGDIFRGDSSLMIAGFSFGDRLIRVDQRVKNNSGGSIINYDAPLCWDSKDSSREGVHYSEIIKVKRISVRDKFFVAAIATGHSNHERRIIASELTDDLKFKENGLFITFTQARDGNQPDVYSLAISGFNIDLAAEAEKRYMQIHDEAVFRVNNRERLSKNMTLA